MVTARSRLRILALAVILSTALFWHYRARDYTYEYPTTPLEKSLGTGFNDGETQESTTTAEYFEKNTNDLLIPTTLLHHSSFTTTTTETGVISAGQTAPSPPPRDGIHDYEDEKKKYEEEMEKYEGANQQHSQPVQENPESGIFLDKTEEKTINKYNMTTHKAHAHQSPSLDEVDWSRFAYIQYVTNADYLCNSVMIFETLHRLGSRADRVMMYPELMLDPNATESTTSYGKLLIKARDMYNVTLVPIEIQHREGADTTWADSFTKLLAFNITQYDRVLSLDSDGTILQPMDELFLLPPCTIAMPRAYWLLAEDPPKNELSSQIMLIEPDQFEFERIMEKIATTNENEYDMEIVNHLYRDSAMILPHRPYDMLTGEWRRKDHSHYLGSDREEWDPEAALNETKYLHFSDWPVPKPWMAASKAVIKEAQPRCQTVNGKKNCVERNTWRKFYTDFADHRLRVCEVGLVTEFQPTK